ncbi:MAG: DUF4296 domain-containing protein [Bacteroidota bacterium]
MFSKINNKIIFFGFIYICLFISIMISCQQKKSDIIPDNILSKEKMTKVLTDIHIAEAQTNLYIMNDTAFKDTIGFQKIFSINQITKKQYEESLSFYIDHPIMLNEIYEEVVNELSKMTTK